MPNALTARIQSKQLRQNASEVLAMIEEHGNFDGRHHFRYTRRQRIQHFEQIVTICVAMECAHARRTNQRDPIDVEEKWQHGRCHRPDAKYTEHTTWNAKKVIGMQFHF